VQALTEAAATLDTAWIVDRMVLFESLLGGGPARYVPLTTAALEGTALQDPGGAL
jgi:hypothetical protein